MNDCIRCRLQIEAPKHICQVCIFVTEKLIKLRKLEKLRMNQPIQPKGTGYTPPEPGVKYDDKKITWSLLPWEPLKEVVKVLMFGAKKYSVDNWKKVPDAEDRYWDATMRHILAIKAGEILDPESKMPHFAHATCCLLFLGWFQLNRTIKTK